ncbi:MAG TPA: hypothetical protein VGJ92_01905 [Methanocella sp.]
MTGQQEFSRNNQDGKLYLYTSFHSNLKFSSIPEDQYSLVLDRCYWPLLDLLDDYDVSLGIEFPASTLEIINGIDSDYIDTLKGQWKAGRCEVIGSGYSQTIFPLIPAQANYVNLLQGNALYEKILGRVPETALVNEQTYSAGLVDNYLKAGYKNLIMDWDNANKFNNYPRTYRYRPQTVVGAGGARMNLVWNSTIAFQKFQRYASGQLPIEEYLDYIGSQYSESEDRAFVIYGYDSEVFDYRPGHGELLPGQSAASDFQRIRSLLDAFEKDPRISLITPGQVVSRFPREHEVHIESPECPIPTKKQDKYNVTRWAVCGRENSRINTQCYRLFYKLQNIEALNELAGDRMSRAELDDLWLKLTNLWSSDFRTHTTDEKYMGFRIKLGATQEQSDEILKCLSGQVPVEGDFALVNPHGFDWDEVYEFNAQFDRGRFTQGLSVELDGQPVKTQLEDAEYYRDGSIRAVRIVIRPRVKARSTAQGRYVLAESESTGGQEVDAGRSTVKTPQVSVQFSPARGGIIKELTFPEIAGQYLTGELPHGYYDDISFSPDWYTGHAVIYDRAGKKYTDLSKTSLVYGDPQKCPIRIPVRCKIDLPVGVLLKTYYVYVDSPRLDLTYHFSLNNIFPQSFRLGITTINPGAFDRDTLSYSTVNGGTSLETFALKGRTVRQDDPVSPGVSSHHCLGATEGWVNVGDRDKGLAIFSNKAMSYSVPLIHYEDVRDSYFMRVNMTISEMDDTTETFLKGHNKISMSYYGHRNDIESVRKKSLCANNGLLLIKKE